MSRQNFRLITDNYELPKMDPADPGASKINKWHAVTKIIFCTHFALESIQMGHWQDIQ